MAQTHFQSLYDQIAYSWDTATQSIRGDLSGVITTLQGQLAANPDTAKFTVSEFARTVKGLQAETTLGFATYQSTFATILATTGTGLDDVLNGLPDENLVYAGDAGNDTINAQNGNDTIYGGAGDDTITDTGGDNTVDAGAGNDFVKLAGQYAANTVNAGDGNDHIEIAYNTNNTFDGGAGDDIMGVWREGGGGPGYHNTFTGGLGNDYLLGGASTDTYLFNRGDGQDLINDYDWNVQGGTDTVAFGAGINPLDLVFSRNGDHLAVSVHGSTDSVNIQWWYAAPSEHQVESVRAGDGSTLVNTQVEQLIQAMATFSAQNGGITWDQAIDQRPDDVQAILAANWQTSGG